MKRKNCQIKNNFVKSSRNVFAMMCGGGLVKWKEDV